MTTEQPCYDNCRVFINKLKMNKILKSIPIELAQGTTNKSTIHDFRSQELLLMPDCRLEGMMLHLEEWYEYEKTRRVIDNDSLERIDKIILQSSFHFVYIEDLTYQELIALKLFIV